MGKRSVLITGATGFIGRHLMQHLSDFNLLGLSKNHNNFSKNVIQVDLSDDESLKKIKGDFEWCWIYFDQLLLILEIV